MKLRIATVFAGFLSLVLSVANGASNAHLKATSTNGSIDGTQMAGTGNVPVMVKPEGLTFAEQLVGTRSAGKTVTFTNDGSVDVHFTNVFLEGVNANDFSFTSTCEAKVVRIDPLQKDIGEVDVNASIVGEGYRLPSAPSTN